MPQQRWIKILLLLATVFCIPAGFAESPPAIGQSSSATIDYQTLSQRVKQIETVEAYQSGGKELAQKIEPVKQDLEAYVAANPEDVDALVLSVRLAFIEEVFVKGAENKDQQYIDPMDKFGAQHKRLEQAIKIRPDNAKAYYWKARLYGMNAPVIDEHGDMKKKPINLDEAIHYAKQALMLERSNTWYREALAIYYITAGDRKSALEVLDTNATMYNPINVLLKDIESFPLPEGTVYAEEDSEKYSELQLKQKSITDFPNLRAQVFVVPMTASRLEKFFQETWPEFRFFKQARSDLYAQYLVFDPGLRPTYNMGEARAWAQKKLGGIILSVMDVKNPGEAEREMTPEGHRLPDSLGGKFSYVFYVNTRVVE
jgi:tetratricopeptide (TPR) repeat protein